MVLGFIEPDYTTCGTVENPVKVSGSFNGTAITAENIAATAQGTESSAVAMNVVVGE